MSRNKVKQTNSLDANLKKSFQKKDIDRVVYSKFMDQNRNERQKRERELSPHVTSRWYRSPEIILDEKYYDESTDIWSLGCILYELLEKSTFEKTDQGPDNQWYVLFPGNSCYPYSPREIGDDDERDQL